MLTSKRNVLSMCYIKPNKLGAFEVFMLKLTESLRVRGYRHVVVFQESPPDWLAERFVASGARLEVLDFSRNSIKGLAALLRLFRRYRPGVSYWHFFSYWSPYLMLGTVAGGHHVFVDRVSGAARDNRPLPLELAMHVVNVWFLLKRMQFVGVSRFVRERIIHSRKLPARVVQYVWNGIELGNTAGYDKSDLCKELGVPHDVMPICATGHLAPHKGFDLIIEALPEIVSDFPKTICLLVGEGPEKTRLSELSRTLGVTENIRFMGRRNDVKEIMRGCDLFVLTPRWQEAFGFVFAEAQASGLPVVASRVGGIPEVVSHEHTGLLVEPENSREIAEAVKSLAADPEKRRWMGANATRRAKELFGIDRMVREYIEAGLSRSGLSADRQGKSVNSKADINWA